MSNSRRTMKLDFTFEFVGHGHYKVTYKSPNTKKEYKALITDMELIDRTKSSDSPKQKYLDTLKRRCKRP